MMWISGGGFLLAWLGGVIGLFEMGEAVHALLLVGLMLLFVALLKARDAAVRRAVGSRSGRP